MECLVAKWWLTTFTRSEEQVSMMMINEFYYSLDQVNKSYIKGKVDRNMFHLKETIIAYYLGATKGDITSMTMCLLHHSLNSTYWRKEWLEPFSRRDSSSRIPWWLRISLSYHLCFGKSWTQTSCHKLVTSMKSEILNYICFGTMWLIRRSTYLCLYSIVCLDVEIKRVLLCTLLDFLPVSFLRSRRTKGDCAPGWWRWWTAFEEFLVY